MQQRRYLCSRDFSLFFVYYYLDYIKYQFAPFHFQMFHSLMDLMDDVYRELAWIMFRESAKTSIAKGFLTWLIAFRKRKYINVDSFDKENSERILFDIVFELQTNQKLKHDFGELFNAKKNPDEITQKRVNNFITNTGVRVEAHSTQESVRGRLHGHQRPDFLLLDDFETNKTKDSVAYTQQVISHINEFKSGLDSTAKILYLGNYITELGSVQSLIDRAKTDVRLLVHRVDVLDQNGAPTWPEKYALTDQEQKERGHVGLEPELKLVSLEDKKTQLGSQVFKTEMMNQPIDEESAEFFKANFRYRTMEQVMAMRTRKFVTIDTALTRNSKSDFTGITKNWVNELNEWNLIAKRYKISSRELLNLIFQFHDEGFEKIGIEEGAFTEVLESFFEDECRIRNKYPYVVMLKHGGTMKESRIRGLIPRYEKHIIYHIGTAYKNECEDLETELLRFPKAIHDDTMDSAQYQDKIAEPPFPQNMLGDEDDDEQSRHKDIGM